MGKKRGITRRSRYAAGQVQRHFTDLTNEQWAKVCPVLLNSLTRRYLRMIERSGWTVRDFANGLAYISRYRCRWKRIPREFPSVKDIYQFNLILRKYRLLRKLHGMMGDDMPFGLEAFYKRSRRRHGEYAHDRRINLRKCDICPRCGENAMVCYGTRWQGSRIVRYYHCDACGHKRVWLDVPQKGMGWMGNPNVCGI
ncbi:transposase [uncultured Desulfovibrio sp.]|uniref:transposase n=1 Tax=uncultured Desulfovibrio sp. TaxID=167968 RepID=UPI00272C4781|nr:transposase [uncultured Desulfovibrio sp.]